MLDNIILFSKDISDYIILKGILKNYKYNIIMNEKISDFEEIKKDYEPLLVFLDLRKYYESEIKEVIDYFNGEEIPVIVIFQTEAEESLLDLNKYKYIDFIRFPINDKDLLLRTKNSIHLSIKNREIKNIKSKLEQAYLLIEKFNTIDGVTGISNKSGFIMTFRRELKRALREQTNLSLLLLNVDYFSKFNEIYGHIEGDKCLFSLARIIQSVIRRPGDFLFRYEGDSFIIILNSTDSLGVENREEAIKKIIKEKQIENAGSPAGIITLASGSYTVRQNEEIELEEIIEQLKIRMEKNKLRHKEN